jgi:hypothetical protein
VARTILFAVIGLFALGASAPALAQDPKVTVKGAGLTPGTINTDVLTDILQEKQHEVRDRIFRNIIIKQFNSGRGVMRNYATYYFLHSTMNDILNGQSHTEISRSVLRNATEFAYVFGLALYSDSARFKDLLSRPENGRIKLPADSVVKRFNEAMDISFELLLNRQSFRKHHIFTQDTTDEFFMVWYNSESQYRRKIMNIDRWYLPKLLLNPRREDSARVTAKAARIASTLAQLETGNGLADMPPSDSMNRQQEIDFQIRQLFRGGVADPAVSGLPTSDYQAIIIVLQEFTRFSRNKNGPISKLLDSYLKSIVLEENKDGITSTVNANNQVSRPTGKSIYYFDTEGFLKLLDEAFAGDSERRYVYFRPFLHLGINYATPLGPEPAVYFASEKFGIMYKFLNPRYTHSFAPGEIYSYCPPPKFGCRDRYWNQPQEKPILSDYFVSVYASGFLYNIANLKSDGGFNYPLLGIGLGTTFFNGLTTSLNLAYPLAGRDVKPVKPLLGVSVDIPVLDYISAAMKKK